MAAEAVLQYGGGCTIKKASAAAAYTPGEVLVIGNRVGVVSGTKPIAIGDDYTLQTSGIFEMPVLGTDTPAEGALLYWDATNNRCTTTASTHKSAGLAVAAKASGPTRMLVDLNASVASGTI
jgi:predicted RecA/RadA family phage recombinase